MQLIFFFFFVPKMRTEKQKQKKKNQNYVGTYLIFSGAHVNRFSSSDKNEFLLRLTFAHHSKSGNDT